MANAIITENALQGTANWTFTQSATTQIQAYCDKVSYNPGDTVSFYVSTQVASTGYQYTIFRLGWYGGLGARQIAQVTGRTGVAQGYWDGTALQNCPTAILNPVMQLLEAGWSVTDTWQVPANACTGIYSVLFQDANGYQYKVNFVVKGNASADYLVERSFMTDQAYNAWGGYSLYTNPGVAALKVSFNRPMTGNGSGNVYAYELAFIHWLEAQGYNLAYTTDIDVHGNASQLLNYKAILYIGHNEYWTKAIRDGAEAAIAAGVSAGFMSANISYWQARLENDNAGNANRTVVCYKVGTSGQGYGPGVLSNDPQYGVNNALVTAQWRDPVLNRPENAMIGVMFWDDTHGSNGAWVVDASADQTYFAGTGLVNGSSYGSDLVGYEWDKTFTSPAGPANLKVIGTSPMTGGTSHGNSNSNTTWYRAPSGALVFATGSVSWTWALDTFRNAGGSQPVVPQMQVLMANIMGALKGPVYGNLGR